MSGSKQSDSETDFYLPDLCASRAAFVVVVIVALLALILNLSNDEPPRGFWLDFGRIGLFLLWIGLASAGALCWSRRLLARMPQQRATLMALAIPVLITILVCEAALRISEPAGLGIGVLNILPKTRGPFMLRSATIAFIVTALALRYFFVTHEWRRNVQMEARWRIDALQARIRPHFLFNSMNTIASLTRSNPARAEEAVEDLADLFRASLSETRHQISLKEELEVARIYQRIEQLRLGDRLHVEWLVADLPMRTQVPSLLIQPLLENAIYHGIESLPAGGTVRIHGTVSSGMIELSIQNPILTTANPARRSGNKIALDNVRQRLQLAFGAVSSLELKQQDDTFEVILRFPATQDAG